MKRRRFLKLSLLSPFLLRKRRSGKLSDKEVVSMTCGTSGDITSFYYYCYGITDGGDA